MNSPIKTIPVKSLTRPSDPHRKLVMKNGKLYTRARGAKGPGALVLLTGEEAASAALKQSNQQGHAGTVGQAVGIFRC